MVDLVILLFIETNKQRNMLCVAHYKYLVFRFDFLQKYFDIYDPIHGDRIHWVVYPGSKTGTLCSIYDVHVVNWRLFYNEANTHT